MAINPVYFENTCRYTFSTIHPSRKILLPKEYSRYYVLTFLGGAGRQSWLQYFFIFSAGDNNNFSIAFSTYFKKRHI